MPQLVKTKRFGEDINNLPIRRNMLQVNFAKKEPLTDKMIMQLNVFCPGVEYRVFCKVDTTEVVAKDRRRIEYLYLQIP